MPLLGQRWSVAMRQAWQYAVSAVEQGLSGAAGLRDYRGGGGAIRTQDWYTLTRGAQNVMETADWVVGQPWETAIPSGVHEPVNWDWAERYVVVGKMKGVSQTTGQTVRREVTVESDELLSLDEWSEELESVVTTGEEGYDLADPTIVGMFFYQRSV